LADRRAAVPRASAAVLEAVHRMLAVPLFVVVVAVDPWWLLRAIALHYKDILSDEDETSDNDEPWVSTPSQYLDKIFQVVLNLPPLSTSGYSALLEDLVGRRDEPGSTSATSQSTVADADQMIDSTAGGHLVDIAPDNELPSPRAVELVDPLALSTDELALLRLLGPPLITTPRAVKRLVNSYALLITIRRLKGETITGQIVRPALVLLAALVGFPLLGSELVSRLYHCARDDSSMTWRQFVGALTYSGEDTVEGTTGPCRLPG
jgi:KAP family P-loop domain